MSSFRFTKDLTSYEIDIALIKRIEEYLSSYAAKILKVEPSEIEKNYQIKLTDSFGTETFSKIGLYKHLIFPNDISEIQINLQYEKPRYLNFVIAFNNEWKSCRVAIELESETPREDIVTIWNGIETILNFHKTNNNLFYGKNSLSIFAAFAGIILPIAALVFASTSSPRRTTLCLSAFFFIITWYTLGAMAHPYTTFDTQKNKTKKIWSRWFVLSFAGVIIFDIFLVLLYKKFIS